MANVGEGATPLMYACQQAREKEVLDILAKRPKAVKEKDRTLKSALHYCAENPTTGCTEALLRVAPELLDIQDEDGYTVLHLAVIAGNKLLLRFLISRNADINILDNEKHSAVHWATVCGEEEALDMLVRAGADLSTADIHGGYPVHYAAQMCSPGPGTEACGVGGARLGLAVLRTLLRARVNVNVQDKDGRQPLLWAASADGQSRDPGARFTSPGSADAILALIQAGASVEAADKDGLTALHCAASRGHTDCVEALVSLCGANVDHIDNNGCTALFYSTTLGHADVTRMLLNLGAEPDRQDRKGRTPAHCGAAKGQLETLRILHSKGANLWLRNVKGDFPLHDAVASGRRELVLWLMELRPGCVNVANNDGRCPVHIASINDSSEMIKLLFDQQSLVNPIMRSSKGHLMTPLDAALHRGHRGCAKYLQLHGGVPFTKLTDAAASLKGGHSNQPVPKPADGKEELPQLGVRFQDDVLASDRLASQRSQQLQDKMSDEAATRQTERISASNGERRQDEASSDEDRSHRRRRRRRRSDHRKKDLASSEESSESDDRPAEKSRPRKRIDRRRDSEEDGKRSRRKKRESSDEGSSEDRSRRSSRRRRTESDSNGTSEELKKSKHRKKKHRSETEESEENGKKKSEKTEVQSEEKVLKVESAVVEEQEVAEEKVETVEVQAVVHEEPVPVPAAVADEEIAAALISAVEREAAEENAEESAQAMVSPQKGSEEELETKEEEAEERAEVEQQELVVEKASEDKSDIENGETVVQHEDSRRESVEELEVELELSQRRDSGTEDDRVDEDVPENTTPTVLERTDSMVDAGEDKEEEDEKEKSKKVRVRKGKKSAKKGSARGAAKGRVLTMTESEERDEMAARMNEVETVIKSVPLGELDGSLGEDSGGSTRNEDSSVLLDSGIEPSPRRTRVKTARSKTQLVDDNAGDGVVSRRSRVPRLCRKGKEDDDDDDDVLHTISVTRTVQSTIRKYHLERRIFYQLLELKRLQIRAGRANEQVLVKRLVDDYRRAAVIVGLKPYMGVFTFRHFERFLYDQLHVLQGAGQLLIPQLKPTDDIDTLSAILKKTRVQLLDDAPENPRFCTHGTHRCHHAAHAYTGIPCAAYITKLSHHEMPKQRSSSFLPRIEPMSGSSSRPGSKRAPKPVTLELTHGREKQARTGEKQNGNANVKLVISLPTERLDKSKRYFVTFTIKGGDETPPEDSEKSKQDILRHRQAKSF